MNATFADWFVTVAVARDRTADHIIRARSQYAAGWLFRQLHPDAEVIAVRPVLRTVLRTEQPDA